MRYRVSGTFVLANRHHSSVLTNILAGVEVQDVEARDAGLSLHPMGEISSTRTLIYLCCCVGGSLVGWLQEFSALGWSVCVACSPSFCCLWVFFRRSVVLGFLFTRVRAAVGCGVWHRRGLENPFRTCPTTHPVNIYERRAHQSLAKKNNHRVKNHIYPKVKIGRHRLKTKWIRQSAKPQSEGAPWRQVG